MEALCAQAPYSAMWKLRPWLCSVRWETPFNIPAVRIGRQATLVQEFTSYHKPPQKALYVGARITRSTVLDPVHAGFFQLVYNVRTQKRQRSVLPQRSGLQQTKPANTQQKASEQSGLPAQYTFQNGKHRLGLASQDKLEESNVSLAARARGADPPAYMKSATEAMLHRSFFAQRAAAPLAPKEDPSPLAAPVYRRQKQWAPMPRAPKPLQQALSPCSLPGPTLAQIRFKNP